MLGCVSSGEPNAEGFIACENWSCLSDGFVNPDTPEMHSLLQCVELKLRFRNISDSPLTCLFVLEI